MALLYLSLLLLGVTSLDAQLSLSQKQDVASLRSRLSDLPFSRSGSSNLRFNDAHLSQWLKYYDNDMQKAEQKFRTCESWLTQNKFQDVANWEPSDEIKKALPFEIIGKTSEGIPVVDFPFGKWDIRKIARRGLRGSTDVVRRFAQVFAKLAEYEEERSGENAVGRAYFIGDMRGFSYGQLTSIKAVATIVRMSTYFNRCQPLGFQHFYGTRAPIPFRIIWRSIITRVLNPKQVGTISIIARFQNWRQPLFDAVPKHLVPDYLGGTHVPNYNKY